MQLIGRFFSIGLIMSLTQACLPTNVDGKLGKSGSSELRATLPEPKIFSDDEETSKKITHFSLNIQASDPSETCKAISGGIKEYSKETDLKASIQMGCNYNLILDIGAIDTNNPPAITAYYKGNATLRKESITEAQTKVSLAVFLTDAGKAAGFSKGSATTPPAGSNTTDLDINVEVGDASAGAGEVNNQIPLDAAGILNKIHEITGSPKLNFIKPCSGSIKPNVQCSVFSTLPNNDIITRIQKFTNDSKVTTFNYEIKGDNAAKYTLSFTLETLKYKTLIDSIKNNQTKEINLINIIKSTTSPTTILGTYSPN